MTQETRDLSKHIVVLDANSATGDIFAKEPDLWFNGEKARHPCVLCVEVVSDSHPYLHATRLRKADQSRQLILVPHHAVVAVFQIGGIEDPRSIGFSVP